MSIFFGLGLAPSENLAWNLAELSAIDGGGVLSPNIPTPYTWYDFTNVSYLTLVSTAITQALDRSGNGRHTDVQGTSTARPTFTSNQVNSLSTAVFDGGDTLICPSSLYSVPNGANTIFTVTKRDVDAGGTLIVISGGTGAGNTSWGTYFENTAGAVAYRQNSVLDNTGNTNTNYQRLQGNFDGNFSAENRVNGGAPTTTAAASVNAGITTISIGARTNNQLFLTGGIAEQIIYNTLLSDVDRGLVDTYLLAKYGF